MIGDRMSVTLTQLRSFLAVIRSGSVTEAADELVVTQPSVSAAVTALSRELGVDLLERQGRGVRPTAAGDAFAPFAAHVIGLLEDGRRAAEEAAASAERSLRIGAVTTAAESFVPALMRSFAASRPELELTLSVGNRGRVLEMLADHEADVVFAGRPPADAERMEAHPFRLNELVLITSADDPLAGGPAISTVELSDRTWLLREPGSGTRAVNEEFLTSQGLRVEGLTVGSNGAIRQAARAGLGVSFVSRDTVADELEAGLLGVIEVDGPPGPRHWHVLRSSVGPARAVVDGFVQFVRDAGDTPL